MSDNSIQEAMLNLIEACGHWNAFDGPLIVRDLRRNRKFWRTAILVGPGERIYLDAASGGFVKSERDFATHRGIPADVLQLTPNFGAEDNLKTLADTWIADSVTWIGFPQARTATPELDEEVYRQAGGDPNRVLIELWWD